MYTVTLRCVCVNVLAVKKPRVEYSECVSVALVIQHAKHFIIFPSVACLPGSAIFFHILPQTAGFLAKKVTGHKMCFDFLYNSCMKLSHSRNSEGHYPKYTQSFR
jgi:hypothetical protein